jgi:hypothetical protein
MQTHFIKQELLEITGKICANTKTLSDFQYPTFINKQIIHTKNNQQTSEFNCTTEQMNIKDLYRMFHPTPAECTFFQQPMALLPQ